MPDLVNLFRKDLQSQIFGLDMAAVDSYLLNPDQPPPAEIDYPSSLLSCFIFLDFVRRTVEIVEETGSAKVMDTFHRLLLPLALKYNKKHYSWLFTKILSILAIVSPHRKRTLENHTSFKVDPDGKPQAIDRRNEGVVKDLSSFPGEKPKTENQVVSFPIGFH